MDNLDKIPPTIRKCLEDDTPNLDYSQSMTWLDRMALPYLRDRRDLYTLHYMLLMSVISMPNAYMLFTRPNYFYYGAAIHLLMFMTMGTKFVLMLHCVCHRKLFRPDADALNLWIPYVLAPFYGQTPGGFYLHHIMMHHYQGNGPADISSTMFYQRDNALHFLLYFARFFFFVPIELSIYFLRKGLWEYALRVMVEYAQFAFWYHASTSDALRAPTFVTFVVPWLFMRFGMMSGNWGQHAFVSPDAPYDDFVTSITSIGTPYNKLAFNDGYHTTHHLAATKHWADHPQDIVMRLPEYIDSEAFIFCGLDFHQVFFCLMLRNYSKLAKHLVWLDAKPRSEEYVIDLIKKRVRKLTELEARQSAERLFKARGTIVEPYTGVQSYDIRPE
jgi:hypothetical protein